MLQSNYVQQVDDVAKTHRVARPSKVHKINMHTVKKHMTTTQYYTHRGECKKHLVENHP